jgi:sulfur-carrier protein
MPRVVLTRHLLRFFPTLQEVEEVDGATVREVIAALDVKHPGLALYIVDETDRLRRHVNVFVGDEPICDREALSDLVPPGKDVWILQALSGG